MTLAVLVFGLGGDIARLFLRIPHPGHPDLLAGIAFGP